MTADQLKELLRELRDQHRLEYFVKKTKGNILTVRFWIEEEDDK